MPTLSHLTSKASSKLTSHFWVTADQLGEAALVVSPTHSNNSQANSSIDLYLFDYQGDLVNELQVAYPDKQVGIVELADLMEGCRLHHGIKYGQLVVQSPMGVGLTLTMHAKDEAMQLSAPYGFNEDVASFFPMNLGEDQSHFLALINTYKESALVSVRLVSGSRTPEVQKTLTGMGSELISIESEFNEYADLLKEGRAYLRLRTRSSHWIGAVLVESLESKSDSISAKWVS